MTEQPGVTELVPGTVATVEVPATSANLGPGFDCFGLAFAWRDRVELAVTEHGFSLEVTGEGADAVPADESHLIIRSALTGLADLGVRAPGLALRCHNTIPHGRGLGSSSAAIVAGLAAALTLAGRDLDLTWLLRHADAIEGHPDNVAAAIHGGFVMAYAGSAGVAVASGQVHPDIQALVHVPGTPVATHAARGLLPATVPHAEAAANSGRAALLVHALAHDPGLLLEATRDWLHQGYRQPAMPEAYALVQTLRARGFAAFISGAGPTVAVLGTADELIPLAAEGLSGRGARLVGIGGPTTVTRRPREHGDRHLG